MSSSKLCTCFPPWQVLALVATHLDPKTLALASCVSKQWLVTMSSDHLWKPICTLHFPAVSTLRSADPTVSYRRLYSIGIISASRRLRRAPEPVLSVGHLIFTLIAYATTPIGGGVVLAVATTKRRLTPSLRGMFRFDVEVNNGTWLPRRSLNKIRVTWNVSLEGYEAVFTMMDCKAIMGPGIDCWMSEELPSTRCCCSGADEANSGMAAEGRLRIVEKDGKVKIENIGVGMLSVMSWRYMGLEDGLRYLEHFLCTN
ncbi:probable F-box protein At5g04010 [Impatiens glandulifera]|uniref:probable F-box protein At5g04010 n=1 Tax=Impatiens glandulifera TaxID=253017 RepID=UPI001FB0ECFD|nr:probable F-box protein At5g04010 [Impatiens glandulifera]